MSVVTAVLLPVSEPVRAVTVFVLNMRRAARVSGVCVRVATSQRVASADKCYCSLLCLLVSVTNVNMDKCCCLHYVYTVTRHICLSHCEIECG